MNDKDHLDKITKEFILEKGSPDREDVYSLIQGTMTLLDDLSPRKKKDKRNIKNIKHNMKAIRRKVRRIVRQAEKEDE